MDRQSLIAQFLKKRKEHDEVEAKVKQLRLDYQKMKKHYDKTEDHLKALQSVGQIIGEVLKKIDEEKYIIKSSSGPRYVVGVRSKIDRKKLVVGARVALDQTTLTIVRILPREVDPMV